MDTSILRKWDIRGIYPTQINEDVALTIGYAYGFYLNEKQIKECIVGRDNRFGGESLKDKLIEGLTDSGINVTYLDIVTTPMLNFACHKLNTRYGIMITASHNPKEDNGFKIFAEKALHINTEDLNYFYDLIKKNTKRVSNIKGTVKNIDIKELYISNLVSNINLSNKRLKVVIDCGNGTASTIIKDVYRELNCDTTFIYSDSNPNFPNHHPDPSVHENLKDLSEEVIRVNADLGIAYDGDADRVGIVDEKGNVIEADKLMAIFSKFILKESENKNIVIDVKCSMALENAIKNYGGNSIMVCNGSAFIESYINHYPAVFGGEYSGHVFFNDRHYGYDDGVYAGLRLQEILCKTSDKLSMLSNDYEKLFNTPEIKVRCDDDKKFNIVNKVKDYAISRNYKYIDIDGVRVNFEDGWALVRSSNTGPNLTLRFEATTEERLEKIKQEFMDLISYLNK